MTTPHTWALAASAREAAPCWRAGPDQVSTVHLWVAAPGQPLRARRGRRKLQQGGVASRDVSVGVDSLGTSPLAPAAARVSRLRRMTKTWVVELFGERRYTTERDDSLVEM